MKLPTFFVPGAKKSGTSSLTVLLRQHPDIFGAPQKEPPFFSRNYDQGTDQYVRNNFSDWSGEKEVFEANPNHLFLPHVPHRISETIDQPKFVVILRNPIDRAHSHWWMKYTSGKETRSFEAAIRKNLDRLNSGTVFTYPDSIRMWEAHCAEQRNGDPLGAYRLYVDMGQYDRHIERYVELFPASAIHVTFLNKLIDDPGKTVRSIWRFLGVVDCYPVEEKRQRVGAIGEKAQPIWRALCRIGRNLELEQHLGFDLEERVRRIMRSWFGTDKPDMGKDVRRMLRDHYRPHMTRLSKLIGRDVFGPEF